MGGPKKGDVAARLVVENFVKYIESFPPAGDMYKGYLEQALISTEDAMSEYVKNYHESIGMGSTLALVHLNDRTAVFAWVGNSRIFHYQYATGEMYVTEVTKIESSQDSLMWKSTPQVIHGSETPTQLQVRTVELNHGDYIFICTDGILEHVDEQTLRTLFGTGAPPEELIKEISALAEKGNTQDNYSCYLIQMDLEDEPISMTPLKTGLGTAGADTRSRAVPPASETPAPEPEKVAEAAPESVTAEPHVSKRFVDVGFVAVAVIALLALGFIAWYSTRPKSKADEYFAQAQRLEGSDKLEDYERAIQLYDSAFISTTDQQKRTSIQKAKQRALEAMQQLKPAPAELVNLGLKAFGEGDYPKANQHLEASLQAYREQGQDVPQDFPYSTLAESYVRIADGLYAKAERTPEEEEEILRLYEKATDLYEDPNLNIANEELLTKAKSRAEELDKKQAEGLVASRGLEALDRNPPATRPNTSPEEKKPASRPTTSPEKKSPASKPAATNRPASRPPAASSSTARTQSRSSLNELVRTNTGNPAPITPSTAASPQRRYLEDGKAWYRKAKQESAENAAYSYRMAAEYLRQAGDSLNADGAYLLGYMYHMGLGVEKDPEMARVYAAKSANMGSASGHYLYAVCLLKRGGRVDRENAIKSLRIAAKKKYKPAVDLLAKLGY